VERRPRVTGGRWNVAASRIRSKGRELPPLYRNPKNAEETWAGRGNRPRWLTAALKSGKKLESFLIK